MVEKTIKRRHSGLPQMDCVGRIQGIPLVENGLKTAENIYNRVKTSNRLFNWYLNTAESVSMAALDTFKPALQLATGPITKIDQVVCKSLDLVEQRVPSVYLPPEMMIWNTKEYMSDHFVRPVVKRANSVKHIGEEVIMKNRVSTYAAEKADNALDVADAVIEKYLPNKTQDEKDETDNTEETGVVHAYHHGKRVSKKLKRRLTKLTISEVNGLKKQSKEAVHILIYAAELIVTDPRLAVQKAKELWTFLSEPEPENQARPHTLEQVIALLTRESARRVVHLVNYTASAAAQVPRNIHDSTQEIFHHFLIVSNSLIKVAHLETLKDQTMKGVTSVKTRYEDLQAYTNMALERLAIFLSGRLEAETSKISPNPRRRAIRRAPNNTQSPNNHPVAAIVGRNQQQAFLNGGY